MYHKTQNAESYLQVPLVSVDAYHYHCWISSSSLSTSD
jgi:hypothetical protein